MKEQQIQELAQSLGTPFYAFESSRLRERISELKKALPAGVDLVYAMKANPFITKALENQVERFEVCSPGEYDICVAKKIPMEKLVISGVYKAARDTERMMKHTPSIGFYTVESINQYRQLIEKTDMTGLTIKVLLRMTTANQFGLTQEEIFEIVEKRALYPRLDIQGIQLFSGTQKTSAKRIGKEIDKMIGMILELKERYGFICQEAEYGAGLFINYFEKDGPLGAAEKEAAKAQDAQKEKELLAAFSQSLLPLCQLAHVSIELGRSIAASCGTFVTRVVDTKKNDGEYYAILDGGLHHITYYGQMMAMKIPYFTRIGEECGEEAPWNLCGSLCSINDLLVKQLPLKGLKTGDLFAFENAGAYCMTEGISLFLSRALPAVVLVTEDGENVILREHLDTWNLNC